MLTLTNMTFPRMIYFPSFRRVILPTLYASSILVIYCGHLKYDYLDGNVIVFEKFTIKVPFVTAFKLTCITQSNWQNFHLKKTSSEIYMQRFCKFQMKLFVRRTCDMSCLKIFLKLDLKSRSTY